MKQHVRSLLNLGAGLGLSLAAAPSFAGFEVLTTAGTPVLKICQGTESNRNPTAGVCQVTGAFPTTTNGVRTFPGLGGNTWALYASNNSQAVIANGTEIGRLVDRIWRRGTSTDYVFGIRITLNNRRWQPPLATCGAGRSGLLRGQRPRPPRLQRHRHLDRLPARRRRRRQSGWPAALRKDSIITRARRKA